MKLQRKPRLLSVPSGAFWGMAGGCLLMALLILYPGAVTKGVREGLIICGELLIPALFPAMVVTGILLRCGAVQRWGRWMTPLTRKLWGLPGCSGAVFLLSMLGGYPIGARCIRHLIDEKQLSPEQGKLMLRFCVGAGPGFAITAVGYGLFDNHLLGLLLWGCQITAALLLSLFCRTDASLPDVCPPPPQAQGVLTGAVRDAADGMIMLCASVLAFSGLQAFLQSLLTPYPAAAAALDLLAEVTAGVQTARTWGSPALAAFALGWGGLCVHTQVAAASGLRCRGFMLFRLFHGGLAALMTGLLFPLLPISGGSLAVGGQPVPLPSSVNTPFTLALLGLVSVFLLLLPDFREKKIKN